MKKWVVALWAIQILAYGTAAGAAEGDGISSWLSALLDLKDSDEGNQAAPPSAPNNRDPFAVSALMRQLAKGLTETQTEDFTATPEQQDKMPTLRLSGFLSQADNRKIALLSIGGSGTFMVREGDTLSVQTLGENTVLKIESISEQSVSISIGTLGQRIIVR